MTIGENVGSAAKPVLIFPGGMPRSLEFLQKCLRENLPVVGASSLAYDVSREKYPAWTHLPFITEPGFDEAIRQAVLKYNIAGIYSPNPVVWNYLNQTLKTNGLNVALVNDSPVNEELSGYRDAIDYARALLDRPLFGVEVPAAKSSMSEIELAALFRHAAVIPGQCDHEKICGLCEISRLAPSGDVVEIGSLWGKSAFVLAGLARRYNIGSLLCVDPWTSENLVQKDEKGLVDQVSAQWDTDEALAVFEMNLLPYNAGHINYLRMPSTDGAGYYLNHRNVTTGSFGTTSYRGEIAILHVDGNHSYKAAKDDVTTWGRHVTAGGWIVIDDYIWPYGDGPKRAGDEFLAAHRDKIADAFVMGSALFIQLASDIV